MDVCTAFLGVDLEEEVYMNPPEGYFRLVKAVLGTGYQAGQATSSGLVRQVLRLHKSLYGLKQSPHVWYGAFWAFMRGIGFVGSRVDGGIFILHGDGGLVKAVVVLYVDDLLVIADLALLKRIKASLHARFQMHDLGEVSFYLGMAIERNRHQRTVSVYQHAYIRAVLERFGMAEAKAASTPLSERHHKRRPNEERCDQSLYQSMIGSLMFAMAGTRPDLAYAIGVLSRYNHEPSEVHMEALKRVFRYLNGTRDWTLSFGGTDGRIKAYADSDYAGDPDDSKSTAGLCVVFGGVIDWRSKKQKSAAQSTTDAEYYAFGIGCMRMTQIIHLLLEFGIGNANGKPIMFTNSKSMLESVKARIYRGTAVAHIATKYHLAADMVRDGEIELEYVPSDGMLADGFTKALRKPAFRRLCWLMGLRGKGLESLDSGAGK